MRMKKLLAGLLSAGIAAQSAAFSVASFASDDPIVINIPSVYCDGLGDVNDVVPESLFYGLASGASFNGAYYNQLDENSKKAYDTIYTAYKGGATTNEITIDVTRTFTDVTVPATGKIQPPSSVNSWAMDIVKPAFLALVYDHPELSWLVNVAFSTGAKDLEIKNNTGTKCDLFATGIKFYLSKAYTDTGDGDKIRSAVSSALTSVNTARGSDKSVYNTLKCINDYLAENITYNTAAANNGYGGSAEKLRVYQTAYSAFYKCNGDSTLSTVCAGYAKGFKVLCDAYGIPCVLVSGKGGTGASKESHMWNYVYINEKWWGVDVTWNDQGANIYYDFFLVGDNVPAAHFGSCTFSSSHSPSGDWSGSGYVFKYPTLAGGQCTREDASAEAGDGSAEHLGGSIGNTGNGGGSGGDQIGGGKIENDSPAGTIWANGRDIKDDKKTADIDETVNFKTYSWQHTGVYSGGKWMVAVAPASVASAEDFIALFDSSGKINKTETDKVKTIASAKIKEGVVTVTAGKNAGKVTVWVYELKKDPVTNKNAVVMTDNIAPEAKTITVLAAAASPLFAEAGDLKDGVLSEGKKAVSSLSVRYNVGGTQDTSYLLIGEKKTAFDSSSRFIGEVKDSGIVNASLSGNTLSVTPLGEGKTSINLKNVQSGKALKLTVNVVKAYSVTFDEGVAVSYKSGKETVNVKSGDFVPTKTTLEVSASGKSITVSGASVKSGKVVVGSSAIRITAE